jgi:predicted small secreted protein
MEKLMQDGLVGIIAGILTTWIIIAAKYFWQRKVTPYLKAVRYQGVVVDGSWIGKSKDEHHEQESRIFLEQHAHQLNGTFIFSFKNNEKDFVLDFQVTGYMWEGYLTLNFIPKDKRVTSYATALLKLHGGGTHLVGQMCFRNVDEEKVTAIPMAVGRDKK